MGFRPSMDGEEQLMDWQAAMRARALAAAPLTALVGQKVTWVSRPQRSALDALTLQTINEEMPQHMTGFDGLNPALVQIDAWASSHTKVTAILNAALDALIPAQTGNGFKFSRAFLKRKGDLPAEDVPDSTIFRASADLAFHYSTV